MKIVETHQRANGPASAAERTPALWQGRTPSPFSVGQVIGVSWRVGWHLLAALSVGILAAVVLLGTVPLYSNILASVQLQTAISRNGPPGRNVEVFTTYTRDAPALVHAQDVLARPIASKHLASFTLPEVNHYYISDKTRVLAAGGKSLANASDISQAIFAAYDFTQAASHIRLVGGALPAAQTAVPTDSTTPPDALIPVQMAQNLGLRVGDTCVVAPLSNATQPLTVRVSGIWEPERQADPYWNGRTFFAYAPGILRDSFTYTVLLHPQTFLPFLSQAPVLSMEQHWIYYTDPSRVTTANMAQVANSIPQVQFDLSTAVASLGANATPGGSHFEVVTGLDAAINSVQRQLALLALPLYAVVAQVVGPALVFVVVIAVLLVDGQASAIATLKSRGASNLQILTGYGVLAAGVAVVAGMAGVWLARTLALALVNWFVPDQALAAAELSRTHLSSFARPALAMAPMTAGAALGAYVMVIAAGRAAGLWTRSVRRDKADGIPWWQRLYLDVALAIICLLAYSDLTQFGTIGVREQLGQQATSPLLLVTPDLLLLAGVLLLLRLFPLLARLGIRLTRGARGPASALAFAQIARNPGPSGRLALLVSLIVSVGLFTVTFNTTLARNDSDRAAYQTGADMRLVEDQPVAGGTSAYIQSQLAALPGVRALTPVFRGQGAVTSSDNTINVDLLAIDPATWGDVAGQTAWQPNYASAPQSRLLAQMFAHQSPPTASAQPASGDVGDAQHPIWALVSATFAASQHVALGSRFTLTLPDTAQPSTLFTAGAIVNDFPTLYPEQAQGGFIVVSLHDYAALRASPQHGPNEFWIGTSANPAQRAALAQTLAARGPDLAVNAVVDRRVVLAAIEQSALQSGVRGLLLAGTVVAALLALLGCAAQSTLGLRQRRAQMAVLRTLGMSPRQLTRLLLIEQLIVYVFGLVAGTLLGGAVLFASLPYLQFSDTALDLSTLGVPPYRLAVNGASVGLSYLAVVLGMLLTLAVGAAYAAHIGIGKALRLGDD